MLKAERASAAAFVSFWAARYDYPDYDVSKSNIGFRIGSSQPGKGAKLHTSGSGRAGNLPPLFLASNSRVRRHLLDVNLSLFL